MAIQKHILISFFILGLALTNCSDSSFSGSSKSTTRTDANDNGGDANPSPLNDNQFGDGSGTSNGLDNGDNGVDSLGNINISDGSATVPVNITFQRFPDNAYLNNCISIAVNSDAPVEVGCNKDATLTRATMVQFKPRPACNKVSVTLKTSGVFNFSTANAANVRLAYSATPSVANFKGFMFYKASTDQLKGLVNDNGDDKAHSDTTFTLSGLSTINYYIENTASACN